MPIGIFFNSQKAFVLLFLNIAQLVLYIGGLALMGQGLLFVLSGQKRDTNLFYQIFQIINKPWTKMARFISPKQIADHQIPFVAFCIIAVLYIAVTLAKIEHCVSIGIETCQ
ncbi:hypothetical protein PHIN10_15200 [Polynucleobacter sp. HIN10]|jgi:cytochrome b561|nr:hypothetical protein PHIN10_15200 [Polynucleobacter sp. HIN10]BEI45147.1 hypothetical protein PHIN11_15190 [Polynucleobacter sp. HIN11]